MKKILKSIKRIFSGAFLKVKIYLEHRRLRKFYIHKEEKYIVKVMMQLPNTIYFVKKPEKISQRIKGSWKIEKLSREKFFESFSRLLKIRK
jgi:hypothetical protein